MNLQDKFKEIMTLQFVKISLLTILFMFMCHDNYTKQQQVNSGHTL